MKDRYSYDKEGPKPCGICGSQVHEILVKGEKTITGVRPPMEVKRVCQNPLCNSNTGDMTFGDVV